MTLRRTLALLAFSSTGLLTACGSGDEGQRPPSTDFSGTYRPADPGAIGSITFAERKNYMLMPSGCAARSCAEVGTYRLEGSSLVLTSTEGRTQTIAVQILETTTGSGTSLVQSLRPMGDLVDPGEQLTNGQGQLNQGDGQKLTGDGQQLAQIGQQLLQMIQQAMMNGQKMNQDNGNKDNAGDKNNNDKQQKNDCQVSFPRPGTPQDQVDAYWARCPNGP